MAAVQPRGDDGGDEELGTVGVGAGVGHGQEEWAAVLALEVLVGELLAVDGLAASTLLPSVVSTRLGDVDIEVGCWTHIATGEVSALEHEVRDDTVELGARVAEALLFADAELTEVLGRLGHVLIIEVEVDAARAFCRSRCQS